MSTVPSQPTPSPLPNRPKPLCAGDDPPDEKAPPKPLLRLDLGNLDHPGTQIFLDNVEPTKILKDAIATVLRILYAGDAEVPPVRSVTLVLNPAPGVAATAGLDIDNDHKQIRFSLDYIATLASRSAEAQRTEIRGIVVHEMVHVWQHNGKGAAPGGLIEGLADFVRLRAGLPASTWKRTAGDNWAAGYQVTAFFLDWIERRVGEGTVVKMNWCLQREYVEAEFWPALCGETVDELWRKYKEKIGSEETGA